MRLAIPAVIAAVACAQPLAAQRTTAQQLRQAQTLYEQLELERAARTLRQLLSPQYAPPLVVAERVQAAKLLGATLVLMGQPDSGVVYFGVALRADPFTDLEPEEFTPAQVGAFTVARRGVFALALRPLAPGRIDPRTERVRFAYATTHAAQIRAELRRGDSVAVVFEAGAAGAGELVWDGLSSGRLATPGRYVLRVHAASRLMDQQDSASVYFDLRTEIAPLEDTLPSLTDLLPERKPGSTGASDLGKGLAVAGGVALIAGPLSGSALGRGDAVKPALVAGAGLVAGIVTFLAARRQRDLPENIAANRRREAMRGESNFTIRARNAERVAAAVLVIAPAAGVGP